MAEGMIVHKERCPRCREVTDHIQHPRGVLGCLVCNTWRDMSESRIGRIKAIDLLFSENHMTLEITLYYGGGLNQSAVMYLLAGKAVVSPQDHVVPENRITKCLVDLHRFLGVTRLSDGIGQAIVAESEAGRIVRLLRLPCDGDAVFLPGGYR